MPSPSKTRTLMRLWFVGSVVVLAYGLYTALFVAPTEATMGNIYRIFYWHVPINIIAEIFPFINVVASIWLLVVRGKNPAQALKADAWALASAEITVVYVGVGLITGMLWAKPVWGIYWTWDARLTTYLLLWVLYVAYLAVRKFASPGQTSTLAAAISIFAAIDVPICFLSISYMRTQHPSPVLRGDGYLDPVMKHYLYLNILAWSIWGLYMLTDRYLVERRRQAVLELDESYSLNESLPGGTR